MSKRLDLGLVCLVSRSVCLGTRRACSTTWLSAADSGRQALLLACTPCLMLTVLACMGAGEAVYAACFSRAEPGCYQFGSQLIGLARGRQPTTMAVQLRSDHGQQQAPPVAREMARLQQWQPLHSKYPSNFKNARDVSSACAQGSACS